VTTRVLLSLSAQAWAIAAIIIWGLNGQFAAGLICCGISLANAVLGLLTLLLQGEGARSVTARRM
jgi:hypothetical protein